MIRNIAWPLWIHRVTFKVIGTQLFCVTFYISWGIRDKLKISHVFRKLIHSRVRAVYHHSYGVQVEIYRNMQHAWKRINLQPASHNYASYLFSKKRLPCDHVFIEYKLQSYHMLFRCIIILIVFRKWCLLSLSGKLIKYIIYMFCSTGTDVV